MKPTSLPILNAALATVAAIMNAFTKMSGPSNTGPIDPNDATIIPNISASLVRQYAYAGGTDKDIADRFLLDELHVRNHYADDLRSARALRRIMLHSYQTDSAKKANASVLIWLGKNELNQTASPSKAGEAEPHVTDGQQSDE